MECHGMTSHDDEFGGPIGERDEHLLKVRRELDHVSRPRTNRTGIA
jgi:hypothetical protein